MSRLRFVRKDCNIMELVYNIIMSHTPSSNLKEAVEDKIKVLRAALDEQNVERTTIERLSGELGKAFIAFAIADADDPGYDDITTRVGKTRADATERIAQQIPVDVVLASDAKRVVPTVKPGKVVDAIFAHNKEFRVNDPPSKRQISDALKQGHTPDAIQGRTSEELSTLMSGEQPHDRDDEQQPSQHAIDLRITVDAYTDGCIQYEIPRNIPDETLQEASGRVWHLWEKIMFQQGDNVRVSVPEYSIGKDGATDYRQDKVGTNYWMYGSVLSNNRGRVNVQLETKDGEPLLNRKGRRKAFIVQSASTENPQLIDEKIAAERKKEVIEKVRKMLGDVGISIVESNQ